MFAQPHAQHPPLVKNLSELLAPLARWSQRLRRWGTQQPSAAFPVERPPRSRRAGARTRVLWNANQIHPYAFTVDEPDRDHYWTD